MSHIKQIGKTYNIVDSNIICKQSIDNLQPKWKEAVKWSVNYFKDIISDTLLSMYVRGSTAQGTSVDTFSDLDLVLILKNNKKSKEIKYMLDNVLCDKSPNEFIEKFKFINGIDVTSITINDINNISPSLDIDYLLFNIKHHSICMYGDNVQDRIYNYTIYNLPKIHTWMILNNAPIVYKDIIRCLFENIINTSVYYTRDIYYQYVQIVKNIPHLKSELKEILEKAITKPNEVVKSNNIIKFIKENYGKKIKTTK
tara:strand:+ start:65 stop:829 length:765 start_codon:yes stop_codon:yes gene_type:complete